MVKGGKREDVCSEFSWMYVCMYVRIYLYIHNTHENLKRKKSTRATHTFSLLPFYGYFLCLYMCVGVTLVS
jgi:hypothetical protein